MMDLHSETLIKLIFLSIVSASFGIYSSFYFLKRLKFNKEYNKLKVLRDARIFQKKKNFKKVKKYLDQAKNVNEEEITNKSFSELLTILKGDETSRADVLLAYQKKAFDVNLKTNCLVEYLNVDKTEINFKGPLAGLPISIKDNYFIKDYFSCAGCSQFLTKLANSNSVLIDVIKDLGGVPFVKTTVPQTMMSFLSSNPIDGITLNPLDTSKSPGGSSSGEAALIGGRGSIVGMGTDIGGSVRLPAACCGIVGLKPTIGRLSKKGLVSLTRNTIIKGTCGILGRDVESIAYLFEHIVNSPLHRHLDPTVAPIDFDKSSYESKSKLKIGYFIFDESYHCVPAVKRGVLEIVNLLKENGHELVYWKPPLKGEEWLTLFLRALGADKAKDIVNICKYDEKDFTIKNLMKLFGMNYFQYLYKFIESYMLGNKDTLIWLRASRGVSSGTGVMEIIEKITDLRQSILNDWEKLGIDIIICPTAGFATLPVKPSGSLTGMLSYQNIWNMVDFPAGTIPVSKVTQSDINELDEKYPKNESIWHLNTFKAQDNSIGMPISVQCVTKPWKEELCLRIMKEIEPKFFQK